MKRNIFSHKKKRYFVKFFIKYSEKKILENFKIHM